MDWLPPQASTFAGQIDFMFWVVVVITGIAFVLVEGALIWFLIKYRTRPGHKAHYSHGNKTAEVVWTAIPALTMVVLGVWSAGAWADMKRRDGFAPDAFRVQIMASQFEWNVTYAGADGLLGSGDDFTVRNQLHIPVDRAVVVELMAEDVLHSFFVPAFRVKQDAVPGMNIPVWFQATEVGEYEIACAELCGNGHTTMGGRVIVHTAEDLNQWLLAQAAGGEAEE